MNPTKKYINIDKYISSKNNIFIDQKKREGEDYDFAIYKPKSKQLLLFQAKYLISNANVKKKSLYESSAFKVLNSFNKLINEKIGEVYLLYISGIYYNYGRKEEAIKALTNKRINCIFYSLKINNFYFDFKNNINDIKLNNSYMLIPSSKYYVEQKSLDNLDFEQDEKFYYKYEKKKKKSDIKETFEKKEIEVEKEYDNSISEEIKNNNNNEINKTELLLQRKTIRSMKDLEKIYIDITSFILNVSTFKNKSIIDLLGPLLIISSGEKKINLDKEYAFLFYLNEETLEFDRNKRLGLIIYNNGVHYFVDLKEDKYYKSYSELIEKFQMDFLYAIGEKNNLHLF